MAARHARPLLLCALPHPGEGRRCAPCSAPGHGKPASGRGCSSTLPRVGEGRRHTPRGAKLERWGCEAGVGRTSCRRRPRRLAAWHNAGLLAVRRACEQEKQVRRHRASVRGEDLGWSNESGVREEDTTRSSQRDFSRFLVSRSARLLCFSLRKRFLWFFLLSLQLIF